MPGSIEQDVAAVLHAWFPAAQVRVGTVGSHPVLPQELALVAKAVDKRRDEFTTGRWLARDALRALGVSDQPLGTGALREPLWPAGLQGSISHDGRLCAVVVQAATGPAIGIDLIAIERHRGRLPELTQMFVANPAELQAAASFGLDVEPEMLLFCLKEAVVKAISREVGAFIDLRDIELRPAATPELRFQGRLLPARLLAARVGGYLLGGSGIG
ncbi:MAG TPA: 4'-phosphopantetheinyl transferase superfamily protein [Ramlibacter sp.]